MGTGLRRIARPARRAAGGAAAALRRGLRARGWELRRTDPDRSLGEHLWHLFPHLGINCVLDVGAGGGAYGQLLRQNGYPGRIVSFEPVGATFQRLVEQSRADPSWRACRYALGDRDGAATITVTADPGYASFLPPTRQALATFDGVRIERTETVEVRRLDGVFADAVAGLDEPRVFLKLTTQGWDLAVVRGAEGCRDRIRALHVELAIHSPYEGAAELPEAVAALQRAGFAVSGLFDRPHHHGFRLAEVDCVMIRTAAGPAPVLRRW